jgi:predicted lipid-binding transport protein (Tim44 family)
MATQTFSTKPHTSTAAQWAVEADGIFCILTGALFLLDANAVSQFMGVQSSTVIGVLGGITLLYGLGLLYDVFKGLVNARLLQVLMSLDFVGTIATIIFLIAAPTALSTEGRWTVLILADVMAAFGIWKYVGMRRLAR